MHNQHNNNNCDNNKSNNTVDFRNFIVLFWAETLAHWNPTSCQKTSTIDLSGFETLKLKIRRLKLWKPTVPGPAEVRSARSHTRPSDRGHRFPRCIMLRQKVSEQKERDPNPQDTSLIRKDTSTCQRFHSTFAALLSYSEVSVRVRVPLSATQGLPWWARINKRWPSREKHNTNKYIVSGQQCWMTCGFGHAHAPFYVTIGHGKCRARSSVVGSHGFSALGARRRRGCATTGPSATPCEPSGTYNTYIYIYIRCTYVHNIYIYICI